MTAHSWEPRYGPHTWEICEACNYDRHVCMGCGEWLDHTLHIGPKRSGRVDIHPCYIESVDVVRQHTRTENENVN